MDAVRFRLVLVTHLLSRHRGEHELRICYHRWSYRVIFVRTLIPHFTQYTHRYFLPKKSSGISPGMLYLFR